MLKTVTSLALFGIAGLLASNAMAIPVVPGLSGFGVDTTAGRGGDVYIVTNLDDDGAGSLRACVDATGPRVCVFEVGGVIELTRNLTINNPNLTIAGQTAPNPGITLIGAGLAIGASDVLVQHISVRPGDRPDGPDPDNRDALLIGGSANGPTVTGVVVDHCSFSWSIDEIASAWQQWDNITLTNNVFANALHNSLHSKTEENGQDPGHGLGLILGPNEGRIAVSNNLFAHLHARNPLSYTSGLVFVNNVVYNYRNLGTDLQARDGVVQRADVVGNLYLEGLDSYGNRPIRIATNSVDLPAGSAIYVAGNRMLSRSGSDLAVVEDNSAFAQSDVANWATAWQAELPVNGGDFLTQSLASVGSRPSQRSTNSIDARLMDDVLERTGRIINCRPVRRS